MIDKNLIIYKFVKLYHILEELGLDLNFNVLFVDNEKNLNDKIKNFNNYLIITNKEYFEETDYNVLIGTPSKIEEYIIINKPIINFTIIDEWHMLNSEEGGAYEKIFKLLKCPFLALSATLELTLIHI